MLEGQRMRVRESVNRIVQLLVAIFQARFPRMRWLETSWEGLLREMVSRQGRMHIQPVRWVSPQGGWKLNSDGYSRGNPGLSGGGGLVRDRHGNFVFGYSGHFGTLTSLHVELRALLLGVKYCIARGFLELHLEANSLTLIRLVQGASTCPWQLQRELDELLQFRQYFRTISYCYKEANSPADCLANYGANSNAGQVFNGFSDLPRLVRGDIRMDKLGFPMFCRRVVGYVSLHLYLVYA
mgnify:CR=1 FL=1